MTSLLYLVRPTHALIGCDSCITNKASPAFSSLQRWMSPAWKALTRPFKKPEFSEVLNWDSVTTQAHQRTILCHQWLHMEMRRPCSDQNTFLMEVMGSLHGVFCLVGFSFGQGHMQSIPVQRARHPKAPFREHPGLRIYLTSYCYHL